MARKNTYGAARRSLSEVRKALDHPNAPSASSPPAAPATRTPAQLLKDIEKAEAAKKQKVTKKPAPGSKAVAIHGEVDGGGGKSLPGWDSGFIGARTRPRYLAQGTLGTVGEAQPGDLVVMGGVLGPSRFIEIAWLTRRDDKETKRSVVEGAFAHVGRPGEWRRPWQGPEDLRWVSAHVHVRFLGLKPQQGTR